MSAGISLRRCLRCPARALPSAHAQAHRLAWLAPLTQRLAWPRLPPFSPADWNRLTINIWTHSRNGLTGAAASCQPCAFLACSTCRLALAGAPALCRAPSHATLCSSRANSAKHCPPRNCCRRTSPPSWLSNRSPVLPCLRLQRTISSSLPSWMASTRADCCAAQRRALQTSEEQRGDGRAAAAAAAGRQGRLICQSIAILVSNRHLTTADCSFHARCCHLSRLML